MSERQTLIPMSERELLIKTSEGDGYLKKKNTPEACIGCMRFLITVCNLTSGMRCDDSELRLEELEDEPGDYFDWDAGTRHAYEIKNDNGKVLTNFEFRII